jgi:hypothetical protein
MSMIAEVSVLEISQAMRYLMFCKFEPGTWARFHKPQAMSEFERSSGRSCSVMGVFSLSVHSLWAALAGATRLSEQSSQ